MITRGDVQRVIDAFILEETLYWWLHPIERVNTEFNAPRRSSASPHPARGCPCRSKTRCNENANVNVGKGKADNILTYRPAWTPRPSRPLAWAPPSAPPPSMDLSSMTDMVTELSRPVDRSQLDQEVEDFNLTYPVNVDDAVHLFSLPPVAGTGTAPTTTTAPPVTTATQT